MKLREARRPGSHSPHVLLKGLLGSGWAAPRPSFEKGCTGSPNPRTTIFMAKVSFTLLKECTVAQISFRAGLNVFPLDWSPCC